MNGAETLRDALLANDVDVCFANPGTSEMHFVAALDSNRRMRCVLGLEEGVVTGAADGYGRMMDRPAATLLHLGPGLANGLANLHNARRARTPVVNVVGDHASYHLALDAPLTCDIESLARPMSHFVRRVAGAGDVQGATNEACAAALRLPGVATLILPADAAWSEAPATPITAATPHVRFPADPVAIAATAGALRDCATNGRRPAFLVGGRALRDPALSSLARIAERFGARILAAPLTARMQRGAGRVPVEKIPYPIQLATQCLADVDVLIRFDAEVPVAFFAYPGERSLLCREDCEHLLCAGPGADVQGAIEALASDLGVHPDAPARTHSMITRPGPPAGTLMGEAVCEVVGRLLPEGAIVCDEALTAMAFLYAQTANAAPHDYLQNTGGAIGIGIPMSIGAALACPDRKVVTIQADGSGMYSIQGLWTQARERLNVLTIVLANRSYAILHHEMRGVGVATLGENARRMLNLDDPTLSFVQLARGMGVEAAAAQSTTEFEDLVQLAMRRPGPFLIEAVL